MKRIAAIFTTLLICLILCFTSAGSVFAEDPVATGSSPGKSLSLQMDKISPQNGSTNMQLQTVGIKLYFDGNVSDESVKKNNADCFKFIGPKDKEIPCKAFFDTSNTGYILVTVMPKTKNNMLKEKTDYKLTISENLMATDGRLLGEDVILKYRTVDMSRSTKVYMVLMVFMVVGMIGMTQFQNKRKQKAEKEVAAKEGKVNPYKLAKEKKISVQEAMDIIERDKQRRIKRMQKAGIDQEEEKEAAEKAAARRNIKRVAAPRPISDAGSTFVPKRSKPKPNKDVKEKAERAARERAASQGGKKKGKGSKGRKR